MTKTKSLTTEWNITYTYLLIISTIVISILIVHRIMYPLTIEPFWQTDYECLEWECLGGSCTYEEIKEYCDDSVAGEIVKKDIYIIEGKWHHNGLFCRWKYNESNGRMNLIEYKCIRRQAVEVWK